MYLAKVEIEDEISGTVVSRGFKRKTFKLTKIRPLSRQFERRRHQKKNKTKGFLALEFKFEKHFEESEEIGY